MGREQRRRREARPAAGTPIQLEPVDYFRFAKRAVDVQLAHQAVDRAIVAARQAEARRDAVAEEMAKKYPGLDISKGRNFKGDDDACTITPL